MATNQSLDTKKLAAVMRAEFRMQQTIERLEWEENVLKPVLQEHTEHFATPGQEKKYTYDWSQVEKTTGKKRSSKGSTLRY